MGVSRFIECPRCGELIEAYRNPVPTVDIIIEIGQEIVLIERRNPPIGLAIPGGFVDYGESIAHAAKREALEETGLQVELRYLLGCYSDPSRDERLHTISSVFVARAKGAPSAGDDAARAFCIDPEKIPKGLCFDHERIIGDYLQVRRGAGAGCCRFS
jgi:8-oxo-dGTP diphosphatase